MVLNSGETELLEKWSNSNMESTICDQNKLYRHVVATPHCYFLYITFIYRRVMSIKVIKILAYRNKMLGT